MTFPALPDAEQASGICVETGRGVGVNVADMIGIAVIGSDTTRTILNVRRFEVTLIESFEDRFRVVAQLDPEMID